MKCIDNSFIDFLMYLNGFEISGLKIYDLFKAIYYGDLEFNECYKDLARKYITLETILGDPRLALHGLAEYTGNTRFSTFLREYGNILSTTSDTKTLVSSTLKSEFSRLRANITESMRIIETIYEAVLVITLILATLLIMPFTHIPGGLGVILLLLAWISSYTLSLLVLNKMMIKPPPELVILDFMYMLLGGVISVSFQHGVFIHLATLLILHILASKLVNYMQLLERRSIEILNEAYSRSLLGELVDTAIRDSILSSPGIEYKLVWYGFINGAGDTTRKIKLPVLSRRIISLLTSLLSYSRLDNSYIAVIMSYVDEVKSLRVFAMEKSRYYVVYAVFMALLMALSYYMVSRIPGVVGDLRILSVYMYLGILVSSTPPCIMHDYGLTSSRLLILVNIFATCLYYSLGFLLYLHL